MTVADVGVVVGSVGLIALVGWYFFGPRKTRLAELRDGVQQVQVTVKGGYSPDLIRVRQGVPLRLAFDRRASGECTSRVVLADLAISTPVPAFGTATVEFTPQRPGRIDIACGMNMVHGAVLVEPAASNGDLTAVPAPPEEPAVATQPALVEEDDEEADRRAEVADLSRRVLVGAVLSAPVVAAVMLHEFLGVTVPEVLLNPWVQLALITPVMLYTGWPIHHTTIERESQHDN